MNLSCVPGNLKDVEGLPLDDGLMILVPFVLCLGTW